MYKRGSIAAALIALFLHLFVVDDGLANGKNHRLKSGEGIRLLPDRIGKQTLKRSRVACNYLRARHGMTRLAASAVVGHLIQESKLIPFGYEGDRGSSFGIAQWRGVRFHALKHFAAKRAQDWRNFYTQLDFIAHELETTERRSGRALRASKTLVSATVAFMRFERPSGYSHRRPRNGHAWRKRLSNAAVIAFNGFCRPDDSAVTIAYASSAQ